MREFMGKYNISVVKENINKLIEEHGTTQIELAKLLTISQPQISRNLHPGKYFFTVEQLFTIADYYNVSIDELCEIKPRQNNKPIESLGDIADMLFRILQSNTGLSFVDVDTPTDTIYYPNGDVEENTKSRPAIYFENDAINSFIAEWKTVKKELSSVSCKDKMYDLWKSNTLSVLSSNKKCYNYKNPIEYVKGFYTEVYNCWVNYKYYGIEDNVYLTQNEVNALKEVQDIYSKSEFPFEFQLDNIIYINEVVDYVDKHNSFIIIPD